MISFQTFLFFLCFLSVSFLAALVAILSNSVIRLRKRVDFLEEALKDYICEYISKNLR